MGKIQMTEKNTKAAHHNDGQTIGREKEIVFSLTHARMHGRAHTHTHTEVSQPVKLIPRINLLYYLKQAK